MSEQLPLSTCSGRFDFTELAQLVMVRAELKMQCFITAPGAMLAVGLPLKTVEDICSNLRCDGHSIWVSNINCFGQYSVSGTTNANRVAKDDTGRKEKPKKLLELRYPEHGTASSGKLPAYFASHLQGRSWQGLQMPVIDNVTGDFLPDDVSQIKEQLVKHLTHTVRWETGLKLLVSQGCTRFVEIGYGNTLTKFGFFIDRQATFESYYGDAKAVCVE